MTKLTGLLLVLALLASCVQGPRSGGGQDTEAYPAGGGAKLSQWLDQTVPVGAKRLFSAPSGTDIRQAAYFASSDNAEVLSSLVVTRDYSVREDGRADPQQVTMINPAGEPVRQELTGLPLALVVSQNRRSACVAQLSQTGIGSFSEEQMSLTVWSGPQIETAELDTHALPIAYLDDDIVQLRGVNSFQLEGGLLAPAFSRGEGYFALQVPSLDVVSRKELYFQSPGKKMAATVSESFDPAEPAAATVAIGMAPWPTGLGRDGRVFEFPLHVSYSPFGWQPQLDWLSDERLAALIFMPELAKANRRANHAGLFKLVVLGKRGRVSLIEDHLSGDLPFHASGGLLFYTRRLAIGDGQRWEAWASSDDGLYKRLLWSSADPVYISLEDAEAGQGLLLNVQTLQVFGSQVELKSELFELRLGEEGDPPLSPAPAAERGFVPDNPMVPGEGAGAEEGQSGGPPPISMPEGR